jgi:hypothetical protein
LSLGCATAVPATAPNSLIAERSPVVEGMKLDYLMAGQGPAVEALNKFL